MYRWRRPPPAQETDLTAYLRSTVWGPAEFVGWPPRWLVGEGLLTGVLGAGSIVSAGAVGDRTGTPVLASGEAGLVCAGILVLHLVLLRAGRALVGIVAALAEGLPDATAEAREARALVMTALFSGGVTIARSVRDKATRDRIALVLRDAVVACANEK